MKLRLFLIAVGVLFPFGPILGQSYSSDPSASSKLARPANGSKLAVHDTTILEPDGGIYHQTSEWLETELGASYTHLDNAAFTPWTSVYLDAAHPYGYRKSIYGRLEWLRQFDLSDGDIFLGTYYPLLKYLTLNAEGEFGFNHTITPVWSLFGQLQYQLFPGFSIWGGFRNSEYKDANGVQNEVQLFNASAEYWVSTFRLFYSFYESRGNGGIWNPPSHFLEVGYYYTDSSNINLGFAIGHDVERIPQTGTTQFGTGPLMLSNYDTRTIFLLGRHWLDGMWALSYELSWNKLDFAASSSNLYNAYGIRLGIRRRFEYSN